MPHRSTAQTVAAIALAIAAGPAAAGGFTLAHPYSEGGVVDAWARELSACAERVAGIYVEVIGGGKLGRPSDLADAVADGLVDMAVLPAAALEKRWPEVWGLAQPGQVYDPQDMIKLADSPMFIETLNDLGGRDANLALLAVGWQHATLVGTGSGLDDLQGKKLRVPDTATRDALERVGASSVSIPESEILPAFQYGAIDGAIVDTETVRRGVDRSSLAEFQWSPDFAPFASPILVLMSVTTAEAFGEDVPSRITTECRHVTHAFNARALEDMTSLAKDAENAGTRVFEVGEAERARWRDAFEDVRASRLGGHDPVADAVRDALRP